MKRIIPLFLLSLFIISACKAKGESTMTVSVTSLVPDNTTAFILKDTSISDESWGPFTVEPNIKLVTDIICFSGDTICLGAASIQYSWGVGLTGKRDDYDKEDFCLPCSSEPADFVLTEDNANSKDEDDSDTVSDSDNEVTDEDIVVTDDDIVEADDRVEAETDNDTQ